MADTFTSPLVSPDELAVHLNLCELGGGTSAHLSRLAAAAQAYIFGFTGAFSDPEDPDAGEVPPVPDDVRHAILMVASHLYLCREATSPDPFTTVPFGVHELIGPYRQWAF